DPVTPGATRWTRLDTDVWQATPTVDYNGVHVVADIHSDGRAYYSDYNGVFRLLAYNIQSISGAYDGAWNRFALYTLSYSGQLQQGSIGSGPGPHVWIDHGNGGGYGFYDVSVDPTGLHWVATTNDDRVYLDGSSQDIGTTRAWDTVIGSGGTFYEVLYDG